MPFAASSPWHSVVEMRLNHEPLTSTPANLPGDSASNFDFRALRRTLSGDVVTFAGGALPQPLFSSIEYETWKTGDTPWKLYVYGPPQCGKTLRATAVANSLQDEYHEHSVLVVSIYMDPHDHEGSEFQTSTSEELARNFLLAVLRNTMEEPETNYGISTTNPSDLSPPGLLEQIRAACTSFERKFLILDAYDLCPTDLKQSLETQMKRLLELGFSIMITSVEPLPGRRHKRCDGPNCDNRGLRLYWKCQQCSVFDLCADCMASEIRCGNVGHDFGQTIGEVEYDLIYGEDELQEYVSLQLRSGRDHKAFDMDLQVRMQSDEQVEMLSRRIAERSSGRFGIAKALLDHLRDFQSNGFEEITHVLTRVSLPEAEFYDSLVRKVQCQPDYHKDIGLTALSILAQNYLVGGKLTSMEVADAIKVSCLNITEDLSLIESQIAHCCKGIVYRDEDTNVWPFQVSAGIYLRENCKDVFRDIKVDVANLCLDRLLAVPVIEYWSPDVESKIRNLAKREPFTLFAAHNWGLLLSNSQAYDTWDDKTTYKAEPLVAKAMELLRDEQRLKTCLFLAHRRPRGSIQPNWSAMHLIAWFGMEKLVRFFVEEAKYNQCTIQGRTPTMIAASRGDVDTVKLLIATAGANASSEDTRRASTLMWAIKNRDEDIMFATLDHWNSTHSTPLISSIEAEDDLELFQRMVNCNHVNINEMTLTGQTALLTALKKRSFDAVDILLQQPGLTFDTHTGLNRSALHHAAAFLPQPIISQIMHHPNCTPAVICCPDANAMTPIRLLFDNPNINRDLECFFGLLRLFREQGAALNCIDGYGRGLLHAAASLPHVAVVDWLLQEAAIRVDTPDALGWTPIHLACCHSQPEVLARLLEEASSTPTQRPNGWSCIDVTNFCHPEENSTLINLLRRLDPTAASTSNQPPIWALNTTDLDSLTRVLESVSTAELKTPDPRTGNTILHKAVAANDIEFCKKVVKKVPEAVEIPNLRGYTPLRLAIEKRSFGITESLLQKHCPDVATSQYLLDLVRGLEEPKLALLLLEYGHKDAKVLPGPDLQDLMRTAIKKSSVAGVKALFAADCSPLQRCGEPEVSLKEYAVSVKAEQEMTDLLTREEEKELRRIFGGTGG